MSEPEISRLREDLEAIRQAAGLDLPFNRRDVWIMNPVLCALGAAIACMDWWAPPQHPWVVFFPLAVTAGVWFGLVRSSHQRRAREPARWREMRYGLLQAFLVAPLLVAFVVWEKTLGMPRAAIGSSAAFFVGLALGWFGVIDATRRFYLGCAVPMIVFGLAIPFCDPRQIHVGAGLMLIAIGLASAAIQTWQLRRQRSDTDAN